MSSAATSPDQLSICSIMSRKVMIGSLQVSTIVQQTVLGCNVMMKHIFITMQYLLLTYILESHQLNVYLFGDDHPIESVLEKPNIRTSKCFAWVQENTKYPEAKTLTYAQFLMKFVWQQHLCHFKKAMTCNWETRFCSPMKRIVILFENFAQCIKRSCMDHSLISQQSIMSFALHFELKCLL